MYVYACSSQWSVREIASKRESEAEYEKMKEKFKKVAMRKDSEEEHGKKTLVLRWLKIEKRPKKDRKV